MCLQLVQAEVEVALLFEQQLCNGWFKFDKSLGLEKVCIHLGDDLTGDLVKKRTVTGTIS